MRIAGILCEYNPFHLGHQKQIETVKSKTDYLVCLMSGSFVQRGECAIYDKFTRAKWALEAGADFVFELPCLHVLQSAEGFANGGMGIFNLIGIDTLYFGSECDLSLLEALAKTIESQADAFTEAFHRSLSDGLSYAAAKERAVRHSLPELPKEAFMQNAVLGVEYLLALHRIQSPIHAVALPRIGGISASNARALLAEPPQRMGEGELMKLLPEFVIGDLPDLHPLTPPDLSGALLYRLRTMQKADFAALPDISEGLENRLYNEARHAVDYAGLLKSIRHRRMPLSRMKRVLMCALLGIDQPLQNRYKYQKPAYLRLLGMRTEAAKLIPFIEDNAQVPVVTQPAHQPLDGMLEKDVLATDLHALFSGLPAGLDYTMRLVTL